MDEKEIKTLTDIGRDFMKCPVWSETLLSDQDKKLPQPDLYHEPTGDREVIALPRNFEDLDLNENLFELLRSRKS